MNHYPTLISGIGVQVQKALIDCRRRGFDTMYISVDPHGTTIKPDYTEDHDGLQFYHGAKEVLRLMSRVSRFKLVMYTCSWPDELERYVEFFESKGIHFDYINCNPEAESTGYGYYKDKHYTNVLLDDKAGFIAETSEQRSPVGLNDWDHIKFSLMWMMEQAVDGDEPKVENWALTKDFALTPGEEEALRRGLSQSMEYYFTGPTP